jgi:hypothetical protein
MGLLQSGWLQTSTPQFRATGKDYIHRPTATGRFRNPPRQLQHSADGEYPFTYPANAGVRRKFDLRRNVLGSMKQKL